MQHGDDSAYEHQKSYLKVVFGVLCVIDVRIVRAEGHAMGDAAKAQALETATGQVVRVLFTEAANQSPVTPRRRHQPRTCSPRGKDQAGCAPFSVITNWSSMMKPPSPST